MILFLSINLRPNMKNNAGIPMTEEELQEHLQVFIDIEESIALVMKNGVDL